MIRLLIKVILCAGAVHQVDSQEQPQEDRNET